LSSRLDRWAAELTTNSLEGDVEIEVIAQVYVTGNRLKEYKEHMEETDV